MNSKRTKINQAREIFPRENLQPVFKFNTDLFVYKLTDEQRQLLKVDETNPGVVVVIE